MKLIVVDVEGCTGGGQCAGEGQMRCFGAVLFDQPPFATWFFGENDLGSTMGRFRQWIVEVCGTDRPVFVSDNVAFDWQHINWAFWNRLDHNPFGHSARRIGDYYAGMCGNWTDTQGWKRWRKTPHTHQPVDDARGNCEALWTMLHERT